jgi:hypothetical protein
VAFTAAAEVLLARGRPKQARARLAELEQTTNIRAEPYYAALLPELVRTAHTLGDPELAARLVAGVEPRTPLGQQALCQCRAQLVEATGDHAEAAALYARAAEASEASGNVPERALAASPGGDHPVARLERHAVLVAVVGLEHLAQALDGACRVAIAQAREGRARVLKPRDDASAASRSRP